LNLNRNALVIGASGGIGGALAREYATRGFVITGLSRSEHGLDLLDPHSIDSTMQSLDGPFARVIVATGILAPSGRRPEKSLARIDAEAMAQVFAVNAIGPALIARHLPRLLPRDQAAVAVALSARVGSIGDNRLGGWYSYRASKAALNQIWHTAAIEIARSHRQAVLAALHPGTVDTALSADYRAREKFSPAKAAARLADTIEELRPEHNGGFFDYAGRVIEW